MPDLQQRKTLIPAIALLAVVYFLAGRAGLALALVHPSASAVWPPTGIALAALLLLGYRVWPGVLLGAFLVNFTVSGSPLTAAGIAAGNTLEALVGAYLTNRFANGPRAFERPQDVFKFTFLAAVASPMISATIGVASLAFTGAAPWSGAGPIWVTWHLGDVAGALIVAPLLLLGSQAHPGAVSRGQALEAAVLTLGAAAAGAVTFGALQPWLGGPPPLWFLSTPFLVWAAYRFGPPMTAAIIALLAAIAIWGTLHGAGPFTWGTQNQSLLLLQAYLCIAAVTPLALAAAVLERQRTQRALERLAAIVESSDDAIIGHTVGSVIAEWNRGSERLYGYTAEEAIGKSVRILMPPENTEEFADLQRRLERGAPVEQYETVRVRKDGRRIDVSLSISPVRDASGEITGAACIARDITQRKAVEQLRTEFLSLAAHELKTPLTVIRGASQLVLRRISRGLPLDERYVELLHSIEERSAYMADLINELLDLSRIESGHLRLQQAPADLSLLLRQVVAQQQLLHAERAFVLEGAAVPVQGTWDRARLEQVFTNLLDNAVRYSPDRQPVAVCITACREGVEVTVQDRGIGVPFGELPHLFERHFRGSNVGLGPGGLGLGLYLSNEVVQRHGGRIWAESAEGEGSTFHVALPLHAAPAAG